MNTFANTQSASRQALRAHARKLGTPRGSIAAFAVLAVVGAAAASAGAFGTFTNTASVTQGGLTAGTVALSVGYGTDSGDLTVGASNLAAGDDVERAVDLTNSGTLDLSSLDLGVAATGDAIMTDGTSGALQINVDTCSVAWTEHGDGSAATPYYYTCGGTTQTALASTAATFAATTLSNLTLTAAAVNHLRITATLPSGDDEATYGGKSATLTYTFTATQRTATHQ